MSHMLALRARYVLPVDSPPIADGVVILDGDRIVEVTAGAVPPGTIDLGNVAILPGLVNAHTHLEFSLLPEPLGRAGMGFAEWVAAVIQWRRSTEALSAARWRQTAVRAGLHESSRAGVTTLADVVTFPWPDDAYGDAPTGVVALAEYLAPTEPRASEQWGMLRQFLAGQSSAAPGMRWGVSPHAPYTVRWAMLPQLCELSTARQMPVAMHLAESRDELEFLWSGSGPLRDLLESLGAWDAAAVPPGQSPRDYLDVLATSHRALIVHGNFLDSEEIRFIAARRDRMAVVYCPRTHGYFDHSRYPLAEMLSAGAHVALGTDSRASTPNLQLLEEMRYLAQKHPEIAPQKIVELATLAGAAALGQQQRVGSLGAGKQADLVAVALPPSGAGGPHAFLADPTCRIEHVYQAGKLVFSTGRVCK